MWNKNKGRAGRATAMVNTSGRHSDEIAIEVFDLAKTYAGEVHAFHALWWRDQAKQCWADTLAFLGRALEARSDESAAA